MKKLLKMLSVAFIVMLMMTTSVFAEESLQPIDSYSDYGYDSATFSQAAQSYHSQLNAATEEEYEGFIEYFASYPDVVSGFEEFKTLRNADDVFLQYGPYALYETETGDARVFQIMQYESGYYCFVCGFDSALTFNFLDLYKVDNLAADDNMPATFDIYSYELSDLSGSTGSFFVFDAEVLKGALGNTLIGLGVVFSVLVFISLIISLFKFISPEGRVKKEKIEFSENNKVITTAPAKSVAEDNEMVAAITAAVVTDETQLVAAITAAICAYEGVSSDSFVVRTIKKRKW